jgi:hypothetical protein
MKRHQTLRFRYAADLPICRSADLPICRSADLPICRSADLPICRFDDTHASPILE